MIRFFIHEKKPGYPTFNSVHSKKNQADPIDENEESKDRVAYSKSADSIPSANDHESNKDSSSASGDQEHSNRAAI